MTHPKEKKQEHPIITQARTQWPFIFPLSELDKLSGGAHRRRTIHNLRSKGTIPQECFARQGSRKIIVLRDPFLRWWNQQLLNCES